MTASDKLNGKIVFGIRITWCKIMILEHLNTFVRPKSKAQFNTSRGYMIHTHTQATLYGHIASSADIAARLSSRREGLVECTARRCNFVLRNTHTPKRWQILFRIDKPSAWSCFSILPYFYSPTPKLMIKLFYHNFTTFEILSLSETRPDVGCQSLDRFGIPKKWLWL